MATYDYLNKTGLGLVWAKIKALVPEPEDDIEVLNLLSEFGYAEPVTDADGKLIADADGKVFLG